MRNAIDDDRYKVTIFVSEIVRTSSNLVDAGWKAPLAWILSMLLSILMALIKRIRVKVVSFNRKK